MEQPKMHGELKYAAMAQLALDYETSPEAFEEIQRFCGKYVDERECLEAELEQHIRFTEKVIQNQSAYLEFFDELNRHRGRNIFRQNSIHAEIEPVINRAHGAAGAYMLDIKHDANEKWQRLLEKADDFSTLLANFCLERLNGQVLIIMGKRFEYKLGFLSCQEREESTSNKPKTVVYGTHKRFVALKMELEKGKSKQEKDKIRYGHADLGDWVQMITNLRLITKF